MALLWKSLMQVRAAEETREARRAPETDPCQEPIVQGGDENPGRRPHSSASQRLSGVPEARDLRYSHSGRSTGLTHALWSAQIPSRSGSAVLLAT